MFISKYYSIAAVCKLDFSKIIVLKVTVVLVVLPPMGHSINFRHMHNEFGEYSNMHRDEVEFIR